MGQQQSRYREAAPITQELRVRIMQGLAMAEKKVKELNHIISACRHETLNSVEFLLVLSEVFERLGGAVGLVYPNCYGELLADQFEVAKNGLVLLDETLDFNRNLTQDHALASSPKMKRIHSRSKERTDFKISRLSYNTSKTERDWFDFVTNQKL
jgi:hypothetical protein